jgi:hypothetical protein
LGKQRFEIINHTKIITLGRVPGLGQITWRIVLIKKMRGRSGKKIYRNPEIVVE